MKRDFLKALGLPDEQIDSIMAEHGSTVNNLRGEVDSFKDEIAKRDGQIQTLEQTAGNSVQLQSELDQVKQDNAKWADKFNATQMESKVKLAVAKDVNDPDDILFFINKDALKLKEDGTIEGLSEEVTRIRGAKPYLFTSVEQPPAGDLPPPEGNKPPGSGYVPGSQQRGNEQKKLDPAALALADIERRHGKQKEE